MSRPKVVCSRRTLSGPPCGNWATHTATSSDGVKVAVCTVHSTTLRMLGWKVQLLPDPDEGIT